MQTSDARVSKTSEILGGIRALRQMGWEDIFDARVRKLRDEATGRYFGTMTTLAAIKLPWAWFIPSIYGDFGDGLLNWVYHIINNRTNNAEISW